MKNMLPVSRPIFIIALVFAAITSCKKTETINVTQPTACFSAIVSDPFNNYGWPDTSAYRDFYYYFRNCSDSGDKITYHWDFGDGASSSEKNPKHIYATRGVYAVSLTVTSHNSVQATTVQTVKVISGQRHIDLGDDISLVPIAIEETPANEFVVMARDWNTNKAYFFQLDSMLRKKGMVTFPAGYWFSAMKPATDGNYILTGSTRNIYISNEIIKIKPDGSLLWNKKLQENDAYNFIAPTSDGGYLVIGSRPVPDAYGNPVNKTVVIKTDNNGTQQWEKLFDQENMVNAAGAVIEQDGIVISGNKPGENRACFDCDSALIVKLGNDGNMIWKNAMTWGLNNFNMWDTRTTKLTNGNYVVTNQALTGLLFFSNSGEFLDRKLAPQAVHSVVATSDGNMVNLMTGYGNGFEIFLNKMTVDGAELWTAHADGRQAVQGGYSCCSNSMPVAIRPLRKGGTVSAGHRTYDNTSTPGNHEVIVLIPLDEDGKLK
ncbi:PKD domain-containing protein [Flavihumibacter profundi]|uniref:PKD domain-containing protein n=1 Tax=Flavihumibacter profundi TaxID=2716883 RepID=UPI001CC5F292|nr:PKD domain-containing protein [Flavihumibacter profundi]MBZ5857542.1 PKD domain-containing protein [Flavihumibacter profundi]